MNRERVPSALKSKYSSRKTMELKFYLKKTKASNKGTVYFLITFNKEQFRSSTGQKILIKNWGKGFPKTTAVTKELRNKLAFWKREVDKFIGNSIETRKRVPTSAELRKFTSLLISGQSFDKTKIEFLLNRFLLEQEEELHKNTMRYKRIHLSHFSRLIDANRLIITDLNSDVISKYRKILVNEKRENTTTNNYIKSVKTFLNCLFLKGYTQSNLSNKLQKLKEVTKAVIALNDEELEVLEKAVLEDHLQRQIDIFLFSCSTALSIIDLKAIDKKMVNGDFLILRRKKTGKILEIPLLEQAKEILIKYDYKLPCISDNKGNEHLKTAFRQLGLDRSVRITRKIGKETYDDYKPLYEVISWHKGRKTAITTALKRGIPIELVMQLSGHSKYETMKKYSAQASKELKEQMKAKMNKRNKK